MSGRQLLGSPGDRHGSLLFCKCSDSQDGVSGRVTRRTCASLCLKPSFLQAPAFPDQPAQSPLFYPTSLLVSQHFSLSPALHEWLYFVHCWIPEHAVMPGTVLSNSLLNKPVDGWTGAELELQSSTSVPTSGLSSTWEWVRKAHPQGLD